MPSATWSAHSEHARDKLELYQVLSDLDPPYGGKWHARASVGVGHLGVFACVCPSCSAWPVASSFTSPER